MPRNPLPSGKVVGDYRIGMPLGTGGMADVYYAVDQRLDCPVALKVLRPNLAADETYQQRFNRSKAAAALVHPEHVQIYNVGEDGDLRQEQSRVHSVQIFASAMLRHCLLPNQIGLDSRKSAEATTDRQLPIQETISILLYPCCIGKAASGAGVVHRDIKPETSC
ncbi:MAG: hypothetical protein U0930_17005 [Pirellulales bacterium]